MSKDGAKPEPAHTLVRLAGWLRLGVRKHLTPTEWDLMCAYAAFANKSGTAWPSVETIRQLTGHSRTRLFEALRVLRRLKILEQVGRTARKGMEELGGRGPMIYIVTEPPERLPDSFGLSVHAARTQGPITVHNVRTHSPTRFGHRPRNGELPSTPRESHRPQIGEVPSTKWESERPRHEDRKGFEGVIEGVKEQGGKEGESEGKPRGETPFPPATPLSPSLSSQEPSRDEKQKGTTREEPSAVERIAEYLSVVPYPARERHKAILKRQGYSDQDIDQGEALAWEWLGNSQRVQEPKRCRGLTRDKSSCVVTAEPGSDFCFRH